MKESWVQPESYSKTEIMTATKVQLKYLLQNLVNFLEIGCFSIAQAGLRLAVIHLPQVSEFWDSEPSLTSFLRLVLIYKERSTKFHTKTFKCLKCPYVSLISIFIRDIYSLKSLLKLYTEQLIFPVKDKVHSQTLVFNSGKTIFF